MSEESINNVCSIILIFVLGPLFIFQLFRPKKQGSRTQKSIDLIVGKFAKLVMPTYRVAWVDGHIKISKAFRRNGKITGSFRIRNLSDVDLTNISIKIKTRSMGVQISEPVIRIQHLKAREVAAEFLFPTSGLSWGDMDLEVFDVRYEKNTEPNQAL